MLSKFAELAIDPRNPNRVFVAVLGHPYGPSERARNFPLHRRRPELAESSLRKIEYTGGGGVEIDPSNPECRLRLSVGFALRARGKTATSTTAPIAAFTNPPMAAPLDSLAGGLPDGIVQVHTRHRAQRFPPHLRFRCARPAEAAASIAPMTPAKPGTRPPPTARPTGRIGGGDLCRFRESTRRILTSSTPPAPSRMRSTDGGKNLDSAKGAPGGDDYQNHLDQSRTIPTSSFSSATRARSSP